MKSTSSSDSISIYVAAKNSNLFSKGRLMASANAGEFSLVKMKVSDIQVLLQQPTLEFADVYIAPKEELTTGSLDLGTNKINLAHFTFPSVNGLDLTASIKENRFDTTDIDYGTRYVNSNMASPTATTHASIVATIIAGAGNSSPFSRGVANALKVTSSNFSNLLPDADSVFGKYNISLQNHSYGTVVQNYYGIEAAAYDQQVVSKPEIVHVFSAGNAGTSSATSGIYQGLPGTSNLTGNFKWAKNVITVAAVDSTYDLAKLVSSGPAPDGRVKPELVAFSLDGSSGAAALVSGTAALVQQAYWGNHQKLPPASLVKAILLNTADDVGLAGPDFQSGYGNLNTFNALKSTVDQNYFEGSASVNDLKRFTIDVPQQAAELKITLAWSDPAVAPNSSKALYNDLDLVVRNTFTGEEFRPWVLNHYPHIDSLQLMATRKIDTLNNVEQVSIINPPIGKYVIEVNAFKLKSQQLFSLAYLITDNQFYWSFPLVTDPVIAGNSNLIRWQTRQSGTGKIEWSEDGATWNTIADAVSLSNGFYRWNAPDQLSKGILRMTTSSGIFVSDNFVISNSTALQVGFNCTDSLMLYWQKLPVKGYKLYRLDGNYLVADRNIADTSVILNQNPNIKYYSIAPVIDGKEGLRSYILKYDATGVGCYFRSFYVLNQNERQVKFSASLGTIYNVSHIQLQKLSETGYVNRTAISSLNGLNFELSDFSLTTGVNYYRLMIVLKTGQEIFTHVVPVYYFGDKNLVVYPNPAMQNATIFLQSRLAGQMYVSIYSASGSLVKQLKLKNLVTPVQEIHLPGGVYFIRSATDDGTTTLQKLIVQ